MNCSAVYSVTEDGGRIMYNVLPRVVHQPKAAGSSVDACVPSKSFICQQKIKSFNNYHPHEVDIRLPMGVVGGCSNHVDKSNCRLFDFV